jgi:hypothetical protein
LPILVINASGSVPGRTSGEAEILLIIGPVFVVAGVVGGGAYAVAPLLEGLGGVDELDVLYALGLLMAVWFAAVAVTELLRQSDGPKRVRYRR